MQLVNIPIDATEMASCDKSVAPSTVVRIKIPKGFKTNTKNSYVRAMDNDYDQVDTDEDGNAPELESDERSYNSSSSYSLSGGSTTDIFNLNPFHVNLKNLRTLKARRDYVKFRVFLKDKNYTFKEQINGVKQDGSLNIVRGVYSDKNHLNMFCQKAKNSIQRKRGVPVLTFYVKSGKDQGKEEIASINIVLVPDKTQPKYLGGYDTPIIIDPKIKNDGAPE